MQCMFIFSIPKKIANVGFGVQNKINSEIIVQR